MALFKNIVRLRGFLGEDARTPDSDHVHWESIAILKLCIGSGTWKKTSNEWVPRTDCLEVRCFGPYFCGFTRGMRQGDYVEIEGQLRMDVVIDSEAPRNPREECHIYATQIRRLDCPLVGVEESEDG